MCGKLRYRIIHIKSEFYQRFAGKGDILLALSTDMPSLPNLYILETNFQFASNLSMSHSEKPATFSSALYY